MKFCKTVKEYESILSRSIIFNVKDVYYDIIIDIAKSVFGWKCTRQKPHKETGSEALTHAKADWDVMWIDADFYIDRVKGMKAYQKINHFPGMSIICLKNNLAKYLKLAEKEMPSEFTFFPKTWIFPAESYELANYVKREHGMTFIVKPAGSSQGKGIFITRKLKEITRDTSQVVQ